MLVPSKAWPSVSGSGKMTMTHDSQRVVVSTLHRLIGSKTNSQSRAASWGRSERSLRFLEGESVRVSLPRGPLTG